MVSDIMGRDLVTVHPDTNLVECAKKIVRKRTKSLIIAEGKKLRGFISPKDILWAFIKKHDGDLSKVKAIDISPKKIVTLKPSNDIEEVIKKIKQTKFERFPVVENDELVGVLTIKDILNYKPELYPEFEELEKIKDEEEKIKRIEEEKAGKLGNEGICEECGNQDLLVKYDGMMICGSCRESS